jgi:hypothetical protein
MKSPSLVGVGLNMPRACDLGGCKDVEVEPNAHQEKGGSFPMGRCKFHFTLTLGSPQFGWLSCCLLLAARKFLGSGLFKSELVAFTLPDA